MTDLGRLTLRLDADNKALKRRLKEAETLIERSAKQSGQSFKDSLIQGIGIDIGSRLNGLIFSQLGKGPRFIKSSLATYRQFSGAVKQFGVFAKASSEEIEALEQEAKRLGAQTSKTSSDVANMSIQLVKMGFTAKQATESLNGVVALSEATGESVEASGSIVRVAVSNFDEFTKSTEDVNRSADLITTAVNSSALNFHKLELGLATAGGVANSFNQTFSDSAKILGLLADRGIRAEASATAYKNMILRLANPSNKKATQAMEALGLSVRDAEGNLRSLYEMIPEFQQAFSQFSQQEQGQFAQDLFGRSAVSPFLQLLKSTKEERQKLDQAFENATGTAASNKDQLTQGLGGAINALKGSVEVLKINFGQAFAPGVEASTRFFQSIVDNITANKNLFDDLKKTAKEFTDLLKENPEIAEELGVSFQVLIKSGLKESSELAGELLDYLSSNPDAIAATVSGIGDMVRLLAKAAELAGKLSAFTFKGIKNFSLGADPKKIVADEFGLDPEAVQKRFELLGSQGLSNPNRNHNNPDSINGVDQLAQDALVQMLEEQRELGQTLDISPEEVEKRFQELGNSLSLKERPSASFRQLRQKAFQQLREEKRQAILAEKRAQAFHEGSDQGLLAAAQRESSKSTKTSEQATQDVQKATETAEQAVEEMEANISTSLEAIALAELERAVDIEKLVAAGALSHEQAEIKKLESTKIRIQEELAIEQEKLKSAESEEDKFKAKQAIASKTLDLLKLQQEIEEKTRDMALNKLREQSQLQQQQLGLQQQVLSLQQQELKNYDAFINQLGLVQASLDRQQRLRSAQNNLEQTLINAQIERSNLRLQQLEKAKSLYQQLQGDLSDNQRRVLSQELGRLGLEGRVTEKDILQAIFKEERKQFQLKKEALEQQQEIERKSLEFEKEKTKLQIQQSNLAAERAVKEARFNLEQSKLQNQQRELEAQTKLKEAQIQASTAKTEEEKAQAQALVNLYSQQLGLIQKQGQLLISQGQSAIKIAQQNQQSVAQEGATSLQELGLREEALSVTQSLDRDRLNNEFQNAMSDQRIAESQIEPSSPQTRPIGNVIPVREIPNTRIGGDRDPLPGNKNKPIFVTPQSRENLFNNPKSFDIREMEEQLGLSPGLGSSESIGTNSLGSGKSLGVEDILSSPISSAPAFEPPIEDSPLDSKTFQNDVLANMEEIIDVLRETQPITQNNDYSLYANNDTEILQQAQQRSLDDLVGIINNITGKFVGG